MPRQIVAPSRKIAEAFTALEQAVSAAAQPITGKPTFPISPFYAHEIPGLAEDMDRHLAAVKAPTAQITATRVDGRLAYELSW
jgi:hypothetical protein